MSLRPIDLRDILEYVPRFRDHIFVVSLDGSIVADKNFPSLMTDLAVLHSLNIKVILCHGIAYQLRELSAKENTPITDDRGEGPTNEATLELSKQASAAVSQTISSALAQRSIPFSFNNAIKVRPAGILGGVDQQHTGVTEKIEKDRILRLLEQREIPVFSPIIHDDKARTFRLNSDHLSANLARELGASKLIYLSSRSNLTINGESILNSSAVKLKEMMKEFPDNIDPLLKCKAEYGIQVLNGETDRVHILDGRIDGVLLMEIFDKVGLGTMIHSNDYDRIRPAREGDLADIFALITNASRHNQLVARNINEIKRQIDHFFVYEVDDRIIGCTCLKPYPKDEVAELASVCVDNFHQGKGIGLKLARYTLDSAKNKGFNKVFALSTQAFEFFTDKLGFKESNFDTLPTERQDRLQESGRNSIVMLRELS
ncbi:MAG: amino-acid N-acetyltransferase [Opitutales bacterium]|nr:amino-acid N-acetyltransferase [Opitutales bacterium]